jgi:glycosyltransferase involved in cell wall biosynthesis
MPYFSIIVPVFNRPDEIDELLDSLAKQTVRDFEIILVEDGSTEPCKQIADNYADSLNIIYQAKPNTGRSDSRNVGMRAAKGDYFVFFDSDCVLPPEYFAVLANCLHSDYADCYGGPDRAGESFSALQKAISYAMTSFWTTGGIRGGSVNLEKFVPRTFNMGFSRRVYDAVGGFKDMFGEDIDFGMRVRNAGFQAKLYRNAFVYHKRRVSLKKFYRQVFIFGIARVNLYKLYPQSLKPVYVLPALFVVGSATLLVLSALCSVWFLLPFAAFALLLFTDSLLINKNVGIALRSVSACYIQLYGYGFGFIKSFFEKIVMKRGLEDLETLKKVYK